MSALPDFYVGAMIATALLLAALAMAPLAHRAWLPEPAGFLAVGVIAGVLGIQPVGDLSALELQEIGTLALYAVLFQGGLSTGWTAWRRHARVIGALGLPGTAATAALVAVAGAGLGLSWEAAILIGVALAPTDPAAVYATLRHRGDTPARTILEGESGFNDPVGIAMMAAAVTAIGASGSGSGAVVRLVEELGIGLVGGLVGAGLVLLVLRVTPQLDNGLQAVAVLGVAVLVAAGTAALHGSGFLAIYLTGLLVADRWAHEDGRRHAVPESLAAISEPVLFGLLGAAAAPFLSLEEAVIGVALTVVTVLAVRPLVVLACISGAGLGKNDRLLVWCGGLKGAVPLLLATYPALEALDVSGEVQAVVLVATAASIVLQGVTLRVVATGMPGPAATTGGSARAGAAH
jgi:potassium/hydrogen antiporter